MPKVSIILPVYNKEDYLAETLKALLAQSYTDWELIIVDDGSTDKSSDIVKNFAQSDSRIHSIRQENRGVSAARNTGLQNATGEWIWFVDADDLPDQSFLTNVFSCEFDKSVDIIVGNYERLETDGTIHSVEIEEQGYISADQMPGVFMKYQYKTGFWGYIWNKLINRKLLEKTDIKFQEGLTLAEDLKFLVGLYQSETTLLSVQFNAMRYTNGSTNSSVTKKVDYSSQLELQLEIKEWIVDNCKRIEYADEFKRIISNYAAFIVFYGYEDNKDCVNLAMDLTNNKRIASQFCADGVDSTMLPVVKCLIKKRYFLMKMYLWLRRIITKLKSFVRK